LRGQIREIISPGVGLAESARALGTAERRAGRFPFQWLYGGPNSRNINAWGTAQMPANYGDEAVICTYTVSEGMRFSLRAIVMDSTCPDWEQASGNLLFTLRATRLGVRNVEWFTDVPTRRGNNANPWPIVGRLEFTSLEQLEIVMVPVAVVSLGPDGGFGYGELLGHEYPESEAGEG